MYDRYVVCLLQSGKMVQIDGSILLVEIYPHSLASTGSLTWRTTGFNVYE
jgi:hypothetical protein